ncbi:BTB/POZ domain-containing protein POB1, partial [Thalictrum thalictroides]
MKESSTSLDLFDPRTVMESDFGAGGGEGSNSEKRIENSGKASLSSDGDFGFAFNDSNFSDRILRIEILSECPDDKSDADGSISIADWARVRKRRREDIKKDNPLESVYEEPDTEDVLVYENQDEEAVAMIEESPPGEEAAENSDSSWSMDCQVVLRVRTLHISSPILAAKSPFFYKLFSNGMRESEQRHVTLRVNES